MKPTRKRAPGGGRKPLPPGEHLIQTTVRLSADDLAYLHTIDENLSAAIRKLVQSSKPLPTR